MHFNLILASLLASASLSTLALAQNATTTQRKKPVTQAKPQPAAAPAAPVARSRASRSALTAAPTDFGTVNVQGAGASPSGVTGKDAGGGYIIEEETPKSRSTVTRDAIAKLSPTNNPYQAIELLPGANVVSSDAFGLNGGNITVRGFNSNQIGLTIEGAPINDSGNYALYPQEYVDSYNIGQESLAQGTPDLDSPHIGATGGVLNIYQRDPSHERGGFISQSIGSHLGFQTFGRIESGDIGGFRGFVSYSHYERDHWTGPGRDNRNHVDFKGVYDIDAANRVSLSVIYNEAINNFYFNPTKAQYATKTSYGYSLPSSFFTGSDQSANNAFNYVGFRINPFRNLIVSAPSTFNFLPNLTYDIIPYFWYGFGSGGGTSTLTNGSQYYGNVKLPDSFNIQPGVTKSLYYNPSITETNRPGVINKLTYQFGEHKLLAGYWFEYAMHRQTAPYAPLNSDGTIKDPFFGSGAYVVQGGSQAGKIYQRRDTNTITTTHVLFLGDQYSTWDDRLNIDVGVKQAFVKREGYNYLPGANPKLTLNDTETLPQAGIRYKITPEQQVFASIGTTFRTPSNFVLFDTFSSTGVISTRGRTDQKAETAVTGEIGHRYQGDIFVSSVSLFGTEYKNRQVTTSIQDTNGAFISSNINAGSVTSYGIDAEVGTRPINNVRAYIAGELLRTRINNNLQVGNDFLPTSGKRLPGAPSSTFSIGLDYDNGHMFGNINLKYLGKQFATFTNDEAISGFAKLNAAIGYRFDDFYGLKKPEIRLNLSNLLDERRLTGVNSIQTNALATRGVNGTTISGSSPSYYQGEGFAGILTVSAGF